MNEDTEARYRRQRAETLAQLEKVMFECIKPKPEPESPPWSWWELLFAGIVIAVVLMAVFQPVQVGQ